LSRGRVPRGLAAAKMQRSRRALRVCREHGAQCTPSRPAEVARSVHPVSRYLALLIAPWRAGWQAAGWRPVHAVRKVDAQLLELAGGLLALDDVNIGRAEFLAGVAVFLGAAFVVGGVDLQVAGLLFLVARSRMVDVGQLVEGDALVVIFECARRRDLWIDIKQFPRVLVVFFENDLVERVASVLTFSEPRLFRYGCGATGSRRVGPRPSALPIRCVPPVPRRRQTWHQAEPPSAFLVHAAG